MTGTKQMLADIKAFVAERDAMLLKGDLTELKAFHRKHSPHIPLKDDHILEISLHKARTAVKSLPLEARKISKAWLTKHNYTSLDEGDL